MRRQISLFVVISFCLISHSFASEAVRLKIARQPLQSPPGCLKTDLKTASAQPCALQTDSDEKLVLEFPTGSITLDEVTTVIRVSSSEVRLVSGAVWVQPKNAGDHGRPLTVKTEFGQANSHSEFWVSRSEDRMTISATSGDVEMHPRGTSEVLLVAPGIENFMGRIDSAGRATTGFPVPISPRNHLDRWARLSTNSKKEFESQVAEFKERWVQGVEEASTMQKSLFDRKIASIENAKSREAEARRKVEAHNRELRELFRRKYSSGE